MIMSDLIFDQFANYLTFITTINLQIMVVTVTKDNFLLVTDVLSYASFTIAYSCVFS